ncbi:MAG: ribonuclease D [Pelagibacterales bacterium]|mgnify:FL=1|nr:ribonuclease D [Pelagibacterales bacterium]PPR16716.1 MAG: Ribonuclease D [Alphaproteobacteria bacterium MarineAlpha9_Bin3]|tara:strand:+ start:3301 stop:3918 length:618 start_codon:yes stop_codon:yes gene_type:complete
MQENNYTLYDSDLPNDLEFSNCIAIDTETMGLDFKRDRLCLVQISNGDNYAHLVQIKENSSYPVLEKLLKNKNIKKIFHYARFDLAAIYNNMGIMCENIYCTKIASKLIRTYTDRHGLKELCKELINIDISKQKQSSDWGSQKLSHEQLLYAASDVLYLHKIKNELDIILKRENRDELADKLFQFVGIRAYLDLNGWNEPDIFDH